MCSIRALSPRGERAQEASPAWTEKAVSEDQPSHSTGVVTSPSRSAADQSDRVSGCEKIGPIQVRLRSRQALP